jgi:glycosyltransferase involved in cell wall biosynthesis
VCLGSWQRDLLVRQTGVAPGRAVRIPLGVDERFFMPAPMPTRKEPLVLAVGKDLARDFATFADALRRLGLPAVVATLPRNLERVRLPERVQARFVDAIELRRLYSEAACVVVPQRRDSYPYGSEGGGLTALLEAMASARPLVVTDRPMMREYVEHERTALFVPPEEPVLLSEAIARIVEDRELGASLGASARQRVEAGLTTRHFAAGLATVVEGAHS